MVGFNRSEAGEERTWRRQRRRSSQTEKTTEEVVGFDRSAGGDERTRRIHRRRSCLTEKPTEEDIGFDRLDGEHKGRNQQETKKKKGNI